MKFSWNILTIAGLIMWSLMTGCRNDETWTDIEEMTPDRIVLTLSDGGRELTRASSENDYQIPTDAEKAVTHFDIFVFDDLEQLDHYERISSTAAQVTLSKPKSSFESEQSYSVYVLANCKELSEEDFKEIKTLDGLKSKEVVTRYVQVTGMADNNPNVPKTFMMDGYTTPVTLNDGELTNTEVKVTLRRAAAKVTVILRCGNHAEFLPLTNETATSGQVQRKVVKFADKTRVLPPADGADYDNTPLYSSTNPSTIGVEQSNRPDGTAGTSVAITVYSYSNNWANSSAFDTESYIIARIPISYRQEPTSQPVTKYDNYYKIPLSGGTSDANNSHSLKRNHSYFTTVTIDALGASNPETAVELRPALFKVTEWAVDDINIGGDAQEHPQYLTLNMDTLVINNASEDDKVIFASSSNITSIKIDRVYIINKFGQEQVVQNHGVNVTADPGLNGHLTIHSALPDNSLCVRYIELTVSNGTQSEKLVVEQYPLEYITNTQGWYSYRDDFVSNRYPEPCTYQYRGSGYVSADWNSGKWNYSASIPDGWSSYFFTSKVARNYNSSSGKSDINYYKWSNSVLSHSNISTLNNAHMYHVQITSTPDNIDSDGWNYVLGLPRMNAQDYTDDDADNARIVSPSFMIASQLGAVQNASSVEQAASHCAQYVEVTNRGRNTDNKDIVAYHDWRLPTQAELSMIQRYQQEGKSDAIDVVLTGTYYWAANGIIRTSDGKHVNDIDWGWWEEKPTSAPIRCIRNAYKDGESK